MQNEIIGRLKQDLDSDSYKSYLNLLKSLTQNKATIVCGAGVSVSAKLPSWQNFLEKIVKVFILHWEFKEMQNPRFKQRVPKKMSIAMVEDFFLEDLKHEKIEDFLKEDPLILAQLIKNCIEAKNWIWLLGKALYNDRTHIDFSSHLMNKLCDLVLNNNEIFDSLMTYNYDDLIEMVFNKKKLKTCSVVSENHLKKKSGFPIYHVHGILPLEGGIASKIYLSEEDYLTDIVEPNSWYNQLHSTKLTSNTCVFIGLSFNDPSVKRKLAIHRLNNKHYHYAFLTHNDSEYGKRKFLLLKNELLRLNVRVIKYPYTPDHSYLGEFISQLNRDLQNPKNK